VFQPLAAFLLVVLAAGDRQEVLMRGLWRRVAAAALAVISLALLGRGPIPRLAPGGIVLHPPMAATAAPVHSEEVVVVVVLRYRHPHPAQAVMVAQVLSL
jgi:hypothetical protein